MNQRHHKMDAVRPGLTLLCSFWSLPGDDLEGWGQQEGRKGALVLVFIWSCPFPPLTGRKK